MPICILPKKSVSQILGQIFQKIIPELILSSDSDSGQGHRNLTMSSVQVRFEKAGSATVL